MEKNIELKEHIGILIGIILSSIAAYYIAVYYNEPVNWFLIIINMEIGFLLHFVITITRFSDDDERAIEKKFK